MYSLPQINKNSFLCHINPLSKLLVSLGIFIYCLTTNSLTPLLIFFPPFLIFLLVAGLGQSILKITPFAFLLGGSIILINLLLGGTLASGLVSAVRIFYFFLSFLLFGSTTDPATFIRALERLKVPPFLTLGMLISLRFIPVLQKEMEKISQSFFLRSQDKKKNWSLAYRGLMVPFVFRLFTVSDNMTLALQLRSFGSNSARSSYKTVKFAWQDCFFIFIFMFVMVGIRWKY